MEHRFLRYPGGLYKAVTFSYDDACRADLRNVDIFNRHGLKATFNVNSAFIHIGDPHYLTVDEIKENLLKPGHEIAVHGAHHLAPCKQSAVTGIRDVLDCRLGLENDFGIIVRGMAYPNDGVLNFEPGTPGYAGVRQYLQELGITYSRTLGFDNDSFRLPDDWYNWKPTAHHNNPEIFNYIEKFNNLDFSRNCGRYASPRLFYIWGHSYEFDNNNNWERMEEIAEKLGGREDTWYATNGEIHDYVKAYESLIISADGNRIYNPTNTEIWMECDQKISSIKPGETVFVG